jgi:hypothetical protein
LSEKTRNGIRSFYKILQDDKLVDLNNVEAESVQYTDDESLLLKIIQNDDMDEELGLQDPVEVAIDFMRYSFINQPGKMKRVMEI